MSVCSRLNRFNFSNVVPTTRLALLNMLLKHQQQVLNAQQKVGMASTLPGAPNSPPPGNMEEDGDQSARYSSTRADTAASGAGASRGKDYRRQQDVHVAEYDSDREEFDAHGHRLPDQADEPDEGAWQTVGDHTFAIDDIKLLYLLSLYSNPSGSNDEPEGWIRSTPLMVLIYECITKDVLDFDYAPQSLMVSTGDGALSRRLFLNITQEGKSAIDFLRDAGFINGLKLSSEDFNTVTAFQISHEGLDFLENLSIVLKANVEDAVKAPRPHPPELLQVTFEDGAFVLRAPSGYMRLSKITEPENVSYVSSPYLPSCLRKSEKIMTTNAHRASESAQGESTIRDVLSEALHMANVHLIVGEWIPFGANQIVALNERLGAMDRCKGGLFTAIVDNHPTSTQFQLPAGLTQVTILDFDLVQCINFEADINYPEEEGIVQVENFGIHLNVDGTVLYGLKIESIMDRMGDDVSLDLFARLTVDIHKDSSQIINDLLSGYQRSLLDMVFNLDTANRAKYNVIMAESVDPRLPSTEYLDRDKFENELKQVVGDVLGVHDVGYDDLLIIGREGMIYAGPNSKRHEPLLIVFLSLLVKEMFIRTFFVRIFLVDSKLKLIRQTIMDHEKDPNSVPQVRTWLNESSSDIIYLNEVNSYIKESLEMMHIPDRPDDAVGVALYEVLELRTMHSDVTMRMTDMVKLVDGTAQELSNLSQMTDVINTKQLEDIFRNIEANTKFLVDASGANERASASLDVIQLVLTASFAFDVIDRISGGTLNVEPPEWVVNWIVEPLIEGVPFLWFALNIGVAVLACWAVRKLMVYMADRSIGILKLRVRIDERINVTAMEDFILSKNVEVTESFSEPAMDIKRVTWAETDHALWHGPPPRVELEYDQRHAFLLSLSFDLDRKRSSLTEKDLMRILTRQMSDVLVDYDAIALKYSRVGKGGVAEGPDKDIDEDADKPPPVGGH